MIQDGKRVKFNYTLHAEGKLVDSSKGKSFEYVHGEDKILPGLKEQLEGLKTGEEKNIVLTPENAYGQEDPQAIKEVPRDNLPENVTPELGLTLQMNTATGQKIQGVISGIKDDSIIVDFNHPLAGKTLTFAIKIMEISP